MVAFEINGIFHYKYVGDAGHLKLQKTQHNDQLKLMECREKGIELFVIDGYQNKSYIPKNEYAELIDCVIEKINQKIFLSL